MEKVNVFFSDVKVMIFIEPSFSLSIGMNFHLPLMCLQSMKLRLFQMYCYALVRSRVLPEARTPAMQVIYNLCCNVIIHLLLIFLYCKPIHHLCGNGLFAGAILQYVFVSHFFYVKAVLNKKSILKIFSR
jgi:hypothetical protein